jgi:hypothetical protein
MTVGQTSVAMAQASDATPASAASKQQQKAQRKAARKARRDRKNAELKQLEKNGYDPARGENDYPESLENAQKRVGQEKATPNSPASAP